MNDTPECAVEYVLRRSWLARRRPEFTRRVVLRSVMRLHEGTPPERLNEVLSSDGSLRVGFLGAIWLQLLLTIITRLVIAWWNNRQ